MADIIAYGRVRRRRIRIIRSSMWRLRDRDDPFNMSNKDFVSDFRLTKRAVKDLCEELRPHFDTTEAGYTIEMKVLSSLYFLGSGSFQRVTAKSSFSKISQPSVSRYLSEFVGALWQILPQYIEFPLDAAQLARMKHEFYANTGFPNCVGAIDCTHINITRLAERDYFIFINRKNRFSVNIQMVCDYNLQILDVVARWPGSSHDSYIWRCSNLRELFMEHIPEKKFLIGDSGYPLEAWLLTPYLRENSQRETRFNEIHRSARNVIERCFGVLKSRFRCLHDTGGILYYSPDKVCKIVGACAVLHNICARRNNPVDVIDDSSDDSEDEDDSSYTPADLRTKALRFRDEISYNL